MGNSLNFADYEDPEGPGEDVNFFRGLKLKQIKSFFANLQESRISDFDVDNYEEILSWRTYFQQFSSIKEKMDTEAEVNARAQWHTSCAGYEMMKSEVVEEVEASEEVSGSASVQDDWTDDDLSDDGADDTKSPASPKSPTSPKSGKSGQSQNSGKDGEAEDRVVSMNSESSKSKSDNRSAKYESNNESGSFNEGDNEGSRRDNEESSATSYSSSTRSPSKPKKKPAGWDPSLTSPIFFGYSQFKTVDKLQQQAIETEKTKIAEERAIATAQESRVMFIEEFDRAIKNQETVRLKKISDLETKYSTAKEKALGDYDRNERDLPAMAFKNYKVIAMISIGNIKCEVLPCKQVTWLEETTAAEIAFESEVHMMREFNEEKTKNDKTELRKKKEELEAFKDVNKQEIPAAERLEIIARLEIKRWIEEVCAA
jgi:hypothetical protein